MWTNMLPNSQMSENCITSKQFWQTNALKPILTKEEYNRRQKDTWGDHYPVCECCIFSGFRVPDDISCSLYESCPKPKKYWVRKGDPHHLIMAFYEDD